MRLSGNLTRERVSVQYKIDQRAWMTTKVIPQEPSICERSYLRIDSLVKEKACHLRYITERCSSAIIKDLKNQK